MLVAIDSKSTNDVQMMRGIYVVTRVSLIDHVEWLRASFPPSGMPYGRVLDQNPTRPYYEVLLV